MVNDKGNAVVDGVAPELIVAVRGRIDNVLASAGSDVGDRLTEMVVALLQDSAHEMAKVGYERAMARFVGPVGPGAPANLGKLDIAALAKEVICDIDDDDLSHDDAVQLLAGCFSRLMKLRQDSICAMLDDEHARMARVARAFPTMANTVREQCAVVAHCIRLIDGGMLPAQFMPDTDPVAATGDKP